MILQITCEGSPYEIGVKHGQEGKELIARGIVFYAGLFLKYSKQQWSQVRETTKAFEGEIKARWPAYHEEMRGISDGSGIELLDVIALNVRTEIAFGQFSDGCTSLSWKTEKNLFLGQNWDWMEAQKENLILMTIRQPGFPTIKMVTEAGIIGKIGMNSLGVGVCFNAIRAKGVDMSHLPVHLGLRKVLESASAEEAVQTLEKTGMAASGHFLIADAKGSIGLEFTHNTFARLATDGHGRVYHTNHLLGTHPGVYEPPFFKSSEYRYVRIKELTAELDGQGNGEPSRETFSRLFKDHGNFPNGICGHRDGSVDHATLFRIVMDLKTREAVVTVGVPCRAEEEVVLGFGGK